MNSELKEIWKGESEALLKALHLLTRDGKLNADARRKLKQVNHLTQLIEPLVRKIHAKIGKIEVVDLGAGKSYLGFILNDLLLKKLPEARLTAVESRAELVEKSKQLAQESQFTNMSFVSATIQSAKLEGQNFDFVAALHACDTATDDAILFGLAHGASGFALVPCCQAELAQSLSTLRSSPSPFLFEHALHRREFGSHLTNVIRTLFLKSQGFKVTVTELVGWEHSMKNELILAEKISNPEHPESKRAQAELTLLLGQFPVKMKLLENFPAFGREVSI